MAAAPASITSVFDAPASTPPGFAARATFSTPSAPTSPAASPVPATSTAMVSASTPHYHPPYEEMILSAIEALKDRKGSSRQAISKYITENYSNLPPTHASLLAHHLERLLSKGVICMSRFSYKLADGSKKRDLPWKTAAHPGSPAATSKPKRHGRPPKLRSVTSAMKKKRPGRPAKSAIPADPASICIIPQANQLKTDILRDFPGAAAIVLPKSILSVKAAKNSLVIFPNVIQSLIDASTNSKKRGRPRNVDITEKPVPSRKAGKRKPGRPRKKPLVRNQEMVGFGEGQYNPVIPVAKVPGRPWKIRDMLVPGSVHSVVSCGETMSVNKVEPEILNTPGSLHGSETANLNARKRSVGRPRKKPLLEGLDPTPAV